MGVKIDILEILRQKDRLDDVNDEIVSTLSKVDNELNNCCNNLTAGGTALEVSVATLITVISSVTEKLKKSVPNLISFMDTQMKSYNVSLTDANKELNQLISILKATYESDGDILRTYKEANRYINLPSGNEIVDSAMSYVGGSYVYGGKNLTDDGGVDCSSFVREIYEEYGYQLEQTTYYQINQGDIVDISGGNYENLQRCQKSSVCKRVQRPLLQFRICLCENVSEYASWQYLSLSFLFVLSIAQLPGLGKCLCQVQAKVYVRIFLPLAVFP